MALEILRKDSTHGTIMDTDWEGRYTAALMVAGTESVKLRWRDPNLLDNPEDEAEGWVDASFNGVLIELGTTAGAALDVELCREYDYQFYTAVAGAVVSIAKKNIYN